MFLKKLLIIVSVMAVTFASVACSGNVSRKATGNNGNVGVVETLQNGEDEVVLTIETVDISDIEKGKTYQEIKYPVLEYKNNPAMQKSIEELNKSTKDLAEKFKSDNKTYVRDYIKEFNNKDAMYSYDSSMTCTYNSDNYLSLVENNYIFTMGAHPISVVKGHTYDVKTGKKLSLGDFVKDKEELKQYLKDWIAKQEDGMFFPEANDSVDAYFKGEYELQFALYENEFHIIFQEYDIAPYAAGVIEVNVDKSLLKVELN